MNITRNPENGGRIPGVVHSSAEKTRVLIVRCALALGVWTLALDVALHFWRH